MGESSQQKKKKKKKVVADTVTPPRGQSKAFPVDDLTSLGGWRGSRGADY